MSNLITFTVELPVEPTISRKQQIIDAFSKVFNKPFGISFGQRNDGSVWVSSNGNAGIGPKTREKLYKIAAASL
jgi:hypothetical protein